MSYGSGNELAKFETALEAAGLAWWWMELPSGVVFYSENKTRLVGRSPKDFVHYQQFVDIVHKDDQARIMKDMQDYIDGTVPLYETTYRIQHADGTYREFYDRGKIVSCKDGELYIAGIVFDITDINFEKMLAIRKKRR
ncbi:MAG: PAS domain-containing protein [Candidatus Saccharimonas sp.]